MPAEVLSRERNWREMVRLECIDRALGISKHGPNHGLREDAIMTYFVHVVRAPSQKEMLVVALFEQKSPPAPEHAAEF